MKRLVTDHYEHRDRALFNDYIALYGFKVELEEVYKNLQISKGFYKQVSRPSAELAEKYEISEWRAHQIYMKELRRFHRTI